MIFEPSKQKNLFGHYDMFDQLLKLDFKDKLPNKILLSGQKGIGKSTLAYHLINYILSKNEDNKYNHANYEINDKNKSYILLNNKSNPNFDLIDVANEKKNIDIHQIRELISNLNKSSFNTMTRFVLIDNIELLNKNSANALLKVLEEPNDNIIFILINNNMKILPTLKSRCVNFNLFLNYNDSKNIINEILQDNIDNIINHELIDTYISPGKLFKILNFSKENEVDIKNINLKDFLLKIIQKKLYKKDKENNDFIYSFIQLYLRKKISVKNYDLQNVYNYFLKKIHNTKIYNLDEEILFLEFEDKILNG